MKITSKEAVRILFLLGLVPFLLLAAGAVLLMQVMAATIHH
jgi:hypothetical protein